MTASRREGWGCRTTAYVKNTGPLEVASAIFIDSLEHAQNTGASWSWRFELWRSGIRRRGGHTFVIGITALSILRAGGLPDWLTPWPQGSIFRRSCRIMITFHYYQPARRQDTEDLNLSILFLDPVRAACTAYVSLLYFRSLIIIIIIIIILLYNFVTELLIANCGKIIEFGYWDLH